MSHPGNRSLRLPRPVSTDRSPAQRALLSCEGLRARVLAKQGLATYQSVAKRASGPRGRALLVQASPDGAYRARVNSSAGCSTR
ncbi:hypothetical protein GTS_55590 [Gandjariella thermophila]|uniref:Uncharacterized protein n=1 Tax=Gandjariella thermophila TaxID=1931992 RepID=A0A4D4JHQ2_9PSEU|nr:hypothetical protein GTS_55590 [Gandjariella thermophila]